MRSKAHLDNRFHCLFCKGFEERGKSAGVLAIDGLSKAPMTLHVARQAATLGSHVAIYTNGSEQVAEEVSAGFGTTNVMSVDDRAISQLKKEPENASVRIIFDDGSEKVEGFMAHTPGTKPRGPFVEQLSLEQSPAGDIKAGPPFFETNTKGVFAAGDSSGMMKNIPNAIFSGSLAGMGASFQITAERLGQKSLFG